MSPDVFARKVLSIVVCLACLIGAAEIYARSDPSGQIGVKEASELIKRNTGDLLVIDVRTPAEYREGHIPEARNMDFFGGKFDMEVANLPKDKTVLLYCRSGKRSAGAAEVLKKAGVKKILHMEPGMEAWEKAGLPVEK